MMGRGTLKPEEAFVSQEPLVVTENTCHREDSKHSEPLAKLRPYQHLDLDLIKG